MKTPAPRDTSDSRATVTARTGRSDRSGPGSGSGSGSGSESDLDLSVVIPTRDRCESVLGVVDGFLKQDHPAHRFEILVVVDGSTDPTRERVGSLAARAPVRLRVLESGGRGPAAARNLGIRAAGGDIVLMVGDDTVPQSDLVRRHVEAHDAHGRESRLAVVGAAPFVHTDGRTGWLAEWMNRKHLGYEGLPAGGRVSFYHFITSNLSVARSLLLAVDGFDETFPAAAGEDIELGRRLDHAGMHLYFHPEARVRHVHPHTLGDYRRRMVKTGQALRVLARLHPDVSTLAPPGRRRFRAVCTGNPWKTVCFAFLYVWSVAWTLVGWHRAGPAHRSERCAGRTRTAPVQSRSNDNPEQETNHVSPVGKTPTAHPSGPDRGGDRLQSHGPSGHRQGDDPGRAGLGRGRGEVAEAKSPRVPHTGAV